ncbi:acyl-CoA hydrolase [Oikeobacillus pervagus]|uniref:Acyl-CoA hydrolase n=1 Tax=Oikeobacillus pervagus TaxID=1325931 RepID=A0AAJ1T1G9_9BACI|nr:acetyl-CoA hydrolase/transferase C-terminal domain-containing protein [Oikeobacillus pervagus]MDQ0216614.1 acyl-CoA hydrolase [Oikeobacillus pervagus]
MDWIRQYQDKRMSAQDAVSLIEPGDDIITPILVAEPPTLMKALETHMGLRGNRLFQMFTPREIISVPRERLQIISMFMGAYERKAFNEGKIDLLPNHFSDVPKLLKQFTSNQVIMAVVSPMDEEGYFSLGTNCDYTVEMIDQAKTVLLEVNEYMPRTYGENKIHISNVTALIENNQPLPEAPPPKVTDKDRTIGSYVAELIHDGDTLQIGYGSVPNAIMENLVDHKHLSIHTEMIPDKVLDLYESGAVTNEKKHAYKGKLTATFAFGSKRLYNFLDRNEAVCMLPVTITNDVCHLAGYESLVTINATVEVDFLGQCNSEMMGNFYWSGSGGQAEFQIGSRLSKAGRAVLCLHSTAKKDTISRIVPVLNGGTPVTTSKNDVDYIVTEYGIARLRGKTIRERTKELIRIAHPNFREELTFQVKKMGYLI